ncbi:MAG TPA: alpha-hydroxy acid oxidase [Candidatus Acidoferrales bacterium]|jgi:4-hydroxymandelate oxidase|nr:alpha-hydroxy acid oxidase [Candidatus Acidoferrales bacterium]
MPITRREALVSAGVIAAGSLLPPPTTKEIPVADAALQSSDLNQEIVCLTDFEPLAKQKVSPMAWEFFNGAVADEITMRWNLEAFRNIRLKPHCLVDVSHLDTRVTLFGQEHPSPVILAPTAYHKLANPLGEVATARGAGENGTTMVISTMATTSVEDIAAAAKAPLWFQLYVQRDRGFARDLVQRVEAAGCRALCLTVDTPVVGARNREMRAGFALPKGMDIPNLRGLKIDGVDVSTSGVGHSAGGGGIYSAFSDPSLSWKDLDWLLSIAKVPVLTKGVLNPDDADRAVKAGVGGIMVSNHGARNLDTVPATVHALPFITEKVAGRVPVIVDGGIRRGTDVLKAIALGANAVMIGRPYLYALSVAGDAGVAKAVNILEREFKMAMALTGRTAIAAIDKTVLWT